MRVQSKTNVSLTILRNKVNLKTRNNLERMHLSACDKHGGRQDEKRDEGVSHFFFGSSIVFVGSSSKSDLQERPSHIYSLVLALSSVCSGCSVVAAFTRENLAETIPASLSVPRIQPLVLQDFTQTKVCGSCLRSDVCPALLPILPLKQKKALKQHFDQVD